MCVQKSRSEKLDNDNIINEVRCYVLSVVGHGVRPGTAVRRDRGIRERTRSISGYHVMTKGMMGSLVDAAGSFEGRRYSFRCTFIMRSRTPAGSPRGRVTTCQTTVSDLHCL